MNIAYISAGIGSWTYVDRDFFVHLSEYYSPLKLVTLFFKPCILQVRFHLMIYFIENNLQPTVNSRPLEAGGSQQKMCVSFILKFIQISLDLNCTSLTFYKRYNQTM
jgi:hypothetical protein